MAINITSRSYLEAIVNALAQKEGVTFKEGKMWQANPDKKRIVYNPQDLMYLPPLVSKGLILHELGHVKFSVIVDDTPAVKKHPSMQLVYNAFEDVREELLMCKKYGDFAREALANSVLYGMTSSVQQAEQGIGKRIELSSLLSEIVYRGMKNGTVDQYARGYISYYGEQLHHYNTPLAQKVIEACDKTGILDRVIRSSIIANSTLDIQKMVDKELYELIEPLLEEADEMMKQSGMGEDGEEGEEEGGIVHMPPKEVDEWIPSREGQEFDQINQAIPSDEELRLMLAPYINTLARKLNDVLKEQRAIRFTGAKKSGKLLSKNAYKVGVAGETRIFSKRNNPDTPDYHVTFMLDESGSMSGNPHKQTYIAAFLMDEVVKKLKFNTSYMKYESSPMKIKELAGYRNFRSGGNQEIPALHFAEKLLSDNKDNLLLMMTDGGIGEDPGHMQNVIAKLEKKYNGTVIAIGVGLHGNYLKKYFPHFVEVPEISKLPASMISLLKSIIHR